MSAGNSASGIQICVHLNALEFGAGCIFLVLVNPLQRDSSEKNQFTFTYKSQVSFSFLVLTPRIINVVFSSPYSYITCLIYSLLLPTSTLLCSSPFTLFLTQVHFVSSILLSPSYRFSSSSTLEERHWYEVRHTAFVFSSYGPIQWLVNLFVSEAFFLLGMTLYCT